MCDTSDKILGCWVGLAVGDAMGASVRGMKPATVVQCFRTMDDYKDVRPFIGKGVKQYRMKGLYGAQTQAALTACDVLLSNKRIDPEIFLAYLCKLKQIGPENSFGAFRRPEACLRKTLELADRSGSVELDFRHASATFLTLAVPIALYYRGRKNSMIQNILETGRTLNLPMSELIGMIVMGRFIDSFLKLPYNPTKTLNNEMIRMVLEEAVRLAKEALDETLFIGSQRQPKITSNSLSKMFQWLLEHHTLDIKLKDLLTGVCNNASKELTDPISHAAHGNVLTLLPTAVLITLRSCEFASALTQVLHLGGEADKLGAITGTLAGALYGFECIPENWRRNLVNSKEIKLRGNALTKRKTSSKSKNLFEMEYQLTFKEAEEGKRFRPREARAKSRSKIKTESNNQTIETLFPKSESPKERRQYEREKGRKKRERRKKHDSSF